MRRALYGGLTAALALVCILSLGTGSAALTPAALWHSMIGEPGYETERVILLSLRLPRLLAALIAGVGLAVSGTLLQSVMGNPLAGPNIIGVNAGAGLAAVICLSLLPGRLGLLPVSAFEGAFATALLILALARRTGHSRSTVILAGVACTTLFQAAISFLSTLNSDILSQYSDFSIGSFYGVQMNRLAVPGLLTALCLAASLCLAGRLTVLELGDETASALGVRVEGLRAAGLLLASLSAASVVSFAGLLGFVGLVVPHIARRLTGARLRGQLVCSAFLGALLTALADLAGRTLFAPAEIPVGIVTAFVGAPFFFRLLLKKGERHA